MKYDAIISGCGPVGATLAVLLGQNGLNVLVLERFQSVFDKPRAIVLDWEVMRILQFCGIADELSKTISPHPGTDFLGVDGEVIKQFDPLPPPYPLGWAATLMFVQPVLERLLRKKLASLPTVDMRLGSEFEQLEQSGSEVSVRFADIKTGEASEVVADFLIGCDGANSSVRQTLGIGFRDLGFDEWWLVIDAWQQRDTELPLKTTQYCRPSRPATFVVGPDNLRRWEIKLMPGETPEDFKDSAKLNDVWGGYVDTSAFKLWRSATYRFNARIGKKWREGRVFLAGDAMHQTPPFLGQGLCAGLRDASNLAWKLIRTKTHETSEPLLESYEVERLPHVSFIIEAGKEFGLIIGELDEEKARVRDKTLRAQLLAGKMVTARQKFIPNLTTGIIKPGDPLAGTLMVQPRIMHDGTAKLLDDVVPMSFLYFATDEESQSWADENDNALARLGVQRITVGPSGFEEIDSFMLDWATENGVRAAFVRPDRYVYGGVSSMSDFAITYAALAQHLGA